MDIRTASHGNTGSGKCRHGRNRRRNRENQRVQRTLTFETLENRVVLSSVQMSLAILKDRAFALSQAAFQPVTVTPVPMLDYPADSRLESEGLVFQEKDAIVTGTFLDQSGTYVKPQVRASNNVKSMRVFTDANRDGWFEERTYAEAGADYSAPIIQPPINPADIPAEGRVLSQLTIGAPQSGQGYPQFMTIGAEGYARFNGYTPQTVGSSYRVAASNIFNRNGGPEEFPLFREMYATVTAANRVQLLGLVDSADFTGAVSLTLTPGTQTVIDEDATWYPRHDLSAADNQATAFLAYSSLFWKDELDTPGDSTDEAHDIDRLVVGLDTSGDTLPDKVVTARMQIPGTAGAVTVTDFEEQYGGRPVFVSLDQRDRDPTHYQAYGTATYATRDSYAFQILHSDVDVGLRLYEQHTSSEYHDNIVVAARVLEDLHPVASAAAGIHVASKHYAFFPTDADSDNLTDLLEGLLAGQPVEQVEHARAAMTLHVPSQFATITAAIGAAHTGDTIEVAAGTYRENLVIDKNGLRLVGAGAEASILQPQSGSFLPVVQFRGVDSSVLFTGFSVQGGASDTDLQGGGMDIDNASPVIQFNEITENSSTAVGGGISIRGANSNPLIRGNDIHGNYTREGAGNFAGLGGGIYIGDHARGDILDNDIYENSAWSRGGGIYSGPLSAGTYTLMVGGGASNIRGNRIAGNSADSDGGISIVSLSTGSQVILANNLIASNSGDFLSGSGISAYQSSVRIINNTIAGNSGGSQPGYGVYASGTGIVEIRNNIVVQNGEYGVCAPATAVLAYNDVYGHSVANDCNGTVPGTGSMSVDPMFADPAHGDFHVRPGSPTIDAGDPAAPFNDPNGTRNDMGAYGGPQPFSDDPTPALVSVSPLSAVQPEGNTGSTAFTFSVARTNSTLASASVDFIVTGSGLRSASAADFGGTWPSGTVTFAAGELQQTITLQPAAELLAEFDEGFTVALSNPTSGLEMGIAEAKGVILDDDTPAASGGWAIAEGQNGQGGPSPDDEFDKTAFDSRGNMIAVGSRYGYGDAGNNPSDADILVAKYDRKGGLAWRYTVGSLDNEGDNLGDDADRAEDVAVDANGNAYIIGRFRGTVDFDPSGTHAGDVDVLTSAGSFDAFLLKLNAAGEFVWALPIGGNSGYWEGACGIAVDTQGNVLIGGHFGWTSGAAVDFDPRHVYTDNRDLKHATTSDGFVAKYDPDANLAWVQVFGGGGQVAPNSLVIGPQGGIYVGGSFHDPADFDLANTYADERDRLTANGTDGFILKMTADGAFQWVKGIVGQGWNPVLGLAVGPEGDVYATGPFPDTVDFDPGPADTQTPCSGSFDVFAVKLDTTGSFVWVQTVGGRYSDDRGLGAALTPEGNLVVIGQFAGPVDFDPTASRSAIVRSNNGSFDGFLWTLTPDGTALDARRYGGTETDVAQDLAIAPDGRVALAGYFAGTAGFDVGDRVAPLTSVGGYDGFAVSIGPDTVPPAVATSNFTTGDTTPPVSGTVDDPFARVQVTVAGTTFAAVNAGDGTWRLADNTITPALAYGLHAATVAATDPAGNTASAALTITVRNDSFANRTNLGAAASASVSGTNVGYTAETGEVSQSGVVNSAWWTWTAPSAGKVTVDTNSSSFDTYLTLATGTAVGSLTKLAQNDDGGTNLASLIAWPVAKDTQYQISVDGYQSSTGSIALHLALTPGITVTPLDADRLEGHSGPAVFTFKVDRTGLATDTATTVNWAVTGTGANPASAADFVGGALPSGTVTLEIGASTETITLSVAGDTAIELDESFAVTLSNASNMSIAFAAATGTVRNDDTSVSITPANLAKAEGNDASTLYSYTVVRAGVATGTTTVNWTVSGSGTNPADAADFVGGVLPSGTVTFAAGETSRTILVAVNGDTLVELDEGFTVGLSNAVNAQIATAAATGTIQNDDISLEIEAADAAKLEGNSGPTPFTFTITRRGLTTGATTADWAVAVDELNVANAADFAEGRLPSGTVSFAAGETTKTITVDVAGDPIPELNEGFLVMLANASNAQIINSPAPGTIRNDDAALTVSALRQLNSGFDVEFSMAFNPALLNIVDNLSGTLGPADIALVGATVGPIAGSVILDSSNQKLTFVKTGGPLPADSYTVLLRSASNGFATSAGSILDGNGDGTAGDDYTGSFAVAAAPADAVLVSVSDFTRGYGQEVRVPTNSDAGFPLTLSTGQNVTGVDLDLLYDPTLLTITGFSTVIPGASSVFNSPSPGVARITVSSASEFGSTAGSLELGRFTATVPNTAFYGAKQVLHLSNLHVEDSVPQVRASRADDAIHIAAFAGDTSGNQAYSSGDTTILQRIIVGSGTGAVAYPLADPLLLMDLNRSNSITSADATLLQRVIVGIAVPQVPALPTGVAPPAAAGPDPKLYIPTDLSGAPGATVTVPVKLRVTEPGGISVSGMDLAIEYDATKFTVSNFRAGSLLGAGFSPVVNTSTAGVLRVTLSKDTGPNLPLNAEGAVFEFDVLINANAAGGASALNLLQNFLSMRTQVTDNDLNELSLIPAPTNAAGDAVDGILTVGNDDLVTFAIAATDAVKLEGHSGSTAFVFTVTRTGSTTGGATVNWAVAGSGDHPAGAADFADNVLPGGTLTFEPGQATATISPNIAGDTLLELDEGFVVTLSNASGGQIATATAVGTILNDEIELAIAAVGGAANEGDSITFTITRTGLATDATSVAWALSGSGLHPADAADFADGTLPGGTATFAVGETSKTIALTVADDTDVESNEEFTITLSNPSNGRIVGPTASCVIVNDDAPPASTVRLRADFYADNGGTPGSLIANGTVFVGQTFFVIVRVADQRSQPAGFVSLAADLAWTPAKLEEIDNPFDPSTRLVTSAFPLYRGGSLSNQTGSIDELKGGSVPGGGVGQAIGVGAFEAFSVLYFRAEEAADDMPLLVTIGSNGMAMADGSSPDVTIEPQTLDIVAAPRLRVSDNSGAIEDAAIQFSTDLSRYRAGTADSPLVRPAYPDNRHYVEITNDGQSPLTLYETRLGVPQVQLDVMLTSDPADDIVLAPGQSQRFRLTYAPTLPGLADTVGQNFALPDGLVILNNSLNTPELRVALQGASTFNADVTYDGRVNLSELGPLNANFGKTTADSTFDPTADLTGDGRINLSDLGPLNAQYGRQLPLVLLVETDGATNVAEGGETDVYQLVLSRAPTASVEVRPAADAQTTVSPSSALFTNNNWSTAQTVTVAAVDDTVPEGSHRSRIAHTVTSVDAAYEGIPVLAATSAFRPMLWSQAVFSVAVTDNDGTAAGSPAPSAEGGAPSNPVGGEAESQDSSGGEMVRVEVNLYEDAGGVPGELITGDWVPLWDTFFMEIVAADVRNPVSATPGIISLALDIDWNHVRLVEIDSPFDPSNPASPLMTAKFPLFRSGKLDNTTGIIDELSGGSLPAAGIGQALGTGALERLSLLRFQAIVPGASSPVLLQSGEAGRTLADGTTEIDVAFEPLTISIHGTWQNPIRPADVNDDDSVSPLDVLTLINDINFRGTRNLVVPPTPSDRPLPYLDSTGDNRIDAVDVLLVINYLNAHSSVAEGESAGNSPSPSPGARWPELVDSLYGERLERTLDEASLAGNRRANQQTATCRELRSASGDRPPVPFADEAVEVDSADAFCAASTASSADESDILALDGLFAIWDD